MNFWIFAVALLVIPAVVLSWPLITGSGKERLTAIWIILMIPLAGLILYQQVGTPEAINMAAIKPQLATNQQQPHAAQQDQMDDLVASLQQRMTESPDDVEGWLVLGRTLKTLQRYSEAETALSNANRLIPDNPMLMIELAEASLFASGEPQVSPQIQQLIESALAIDPQHQKGLWLLGMAASQDGDDAQAITIWEKLLSQLDATSDTAKTVTQQIEMAQGRLGQTTTEVVVAEFNIPVTITIADELAESLPDNATLFVFIHPAGGAGMPLAVSRVAARGFPLSLHFSDAELLRPDMSLEDFEQLDISARISMSGVANAATGDFQANLVTLDTKAVTTIALHLDQRVP